MSEKIDLGNGWFTDEEGKFKWQYEENGHTLKNVVYLGKFPMISHVWHHTSGHFWEIIFPGTFRIEIPKLHINMKNGWNELRSNLFYAVKAYKSIRSGFVEIQQKYDDGGDEVSWERASDDNPFYVCAVFENGKHIPLPILQRWLDEYGTGISGGLVQQLAILIAGHFNPKALVDTLEACEAYVTGRYDQVVEDTPYDETELLGTETLAKLTGSNQ